MRVESRALGYGMADRENGFSLAGQKPLLPWLLIHRTTGLGPDCGLPPMGPQAPWPVSSSDTSARAPSFLQVEAAG